MLGKGLFSAAGHEHWVSVRIEHGSIDDEELPHIAFTIAASKLTLETDSSLSDAQQTEIQRTMREKVLEQQKISRDQFPLLLDREDRR